MKVNGKAYRTVWMEDGVVKVIHQALLPHIFKIVDLPDHRAVAEAISSMIIRGAGAIGDVAGYGMAQVAQEAPDEGFWDYVNSGAQRLRQTRPTAQNLFYAVKKVLDAMKATPNIKEARRVAQEVAQGIADADAAQCEAIGRYGADLIKNGARVLTHCNAGWLAFADWGSALAPIYMAKRQGKKVFVFADETRPRCQGAILTAWELYQEDVDYAVIADNAAGYFMHRGDVDLVITGADRIAANGDTANKIGTYEKAVLAHENGIPFYIAAPSTTIDLQCPSGDAIPIEERSEEEVLGAVGLTPEGVVTRVRITHAKAHARNPGFDVTPARYIAGIITEHGISKPNKIKLIKPS
jgi:S-methyl-5-thioribose-1-phosphate isomerase